MMIVDLTCPYCEHINSIEIDANDYFSSGIVSCSPDTGGCDEVFAYHIHFKPVKQISKLDFKFINDNIP